MDRSTVKRNYNNPRSQKPEAKKMKLSSEKEGNKRRPNVKEKDVKEKEVISTDLLKEHQLSKERFVNSMMNLSDELKLASEYRRWVEEERKDGMMFPVFDIDEPAEPTLASCCELVSGYENDSTKLCFGFARVNEVVRFSASEANYVPAVRSTVKAFEEMARSCSMPLFDPIARQGYWYSMAVIASSKGGTLLKVDVCAANKQEGEVRFAEAKDVLVKYFSSFSKEVVRDCDIRSIYLKLMFAENYHGPERVAAESPEATCIMGTRSIYEIIGGLKVNLYPWSFFSTGTIAMTSLCETMLKVLFQESCKTVVELGCGTGIVGQFLAKHCQCVLGVDTAGSIAEARFNADENHLKNCTYFNGRQKDIWTTIDYVLQGKPSVMVIVNALKYDYLFLSPVIAWLSRSNQVCKVVYVKMTNTMMKTSKSRFSSLCAPTREPKKHPDDPMPYFPLYALPVNLGAKFFAAVLVLQHVESNFIEELYKPRENYTVKCIRIVTSPPGVYMAAEDPQEERKLRSTSSVAKKNLPISKSNDNANGNTTDVKNVARDRRLSGGHGPAKGDVASPRTRPSRFDEPHGSKRGKQPHRDSSNSTDADHSAGSRNVRVNKDGTLTTRIDASRHDGTLPPQDLRNVLQSRPGHNRIAGLFDKRISPSEIQDLRPVLREKRKYAERHVDVTDDFREERFVDEIISDRNRNVFDSEDCRKILKDKKVMVENISGDRNERSRELFGRGHVRVYENDDPRSFVEENRATHKNEEKKSFRESSRLSRDAETWGETRMRVSFRDELPSGRDLYSPDISEKLHSRNYEPEASSVVKDSALFEGGLNSKLNIRDERDERRKVMFADVQDMRSIDADLYGSGPGRSFDDAELGRRKPKTDDIASGIKTDVRGINIRAGGWKDRDDISSMKDIQYSWKAKPEFNQSFPNAGSKSEQHALSRNSKLQVMGDVRRENPYSDDKPNYFGEADKSSKAEWFPFDTEDGISERIMIIREPDEDRRMLDETDIYKTQIDESERNRAVGESVSERRIFGGPERTGASVDGADDRNGNMFVRAEDRKWQMFETEDRNKQVFSKPNRNRILFGGSEDREKPLYDDDVDRNRSVYGELEDRKRQMYTEPDDRKRQMYSEPVDRKRQMFGELSDRNRQIFGEPDDKEKQVYVQTDDRKRTLHAELEDRKKLMYVDPEDRKRSVYSDSEDRKRLMYVEEPGDRKRSVYVEPEDMKRLPYDEPGDLKRSAYDEPVDRKRSSYDEPVDRKRSSYDEPGDLKRSAYDEPVDRKRSAYDKPGDPKRSAYDDPGDLKRSAYIEPADRKWSAYDEPGDRKRSAYVEPVNQKRFAYDGPVDRKRSAYDEVEDLKRSAYVEPVDLKRSAYDEPVEQKRFSHDESGDLKRSAYDEPVDLKRSGYDEPEDRKRSMYGGPEDRSGYMFSKTDDRNLQVTERSRPDVEVGWNRPTVEGIERNRLMAGEREREIMFGKRTDINITGYYAADSKGASYNRDYAEDRHSFINDESARTNFSCKDTYSKISQLKEDISPKIQPFETRQLPLKAESVATEASKRHHLYLHHHEQQQQHSPLPPPSLLTDEEMVGVQFPAKQAGGSSVAIGKDGKSYVEKSFVKNYDAKNLYMGDRSLDKGPQTYWAVDRGREPAASHQTPSSSWDKVQSSVGHSCTTSWTSSWGQEGRQRDTQEQHGTFRSLPLVDTTKPPPLFSQHVSKYGTSDEPGRSALPSLSTYGQSPQNYGHSYQQYGMSGTAPAQPSVVGKNDMSQYGSWQGGGPGGRNTLSGRSTTGGWGTSGAGNTSNNWSSQSGNAGYTWG